MARPQGNEPQEPKPKLVDSSAPLFSMYNKKAKEHDQEMTEGWKDDAEGILVFTGLFSAVVAQLLGSSLQSLQPNPQNASSFYLGHMYQLTPGSNVSSIPFDDPATFTTPKSAVLVSTLWSFSLVLSLTCALLATLVQRWARRYLHITLMWDDPQKRAQTRELMWRALEKQLVPLRLMVEFIPFILHISVCLFLVGFVVYLFSFNSLVAKLVAGCAGISLILYLYSSFAPIYSCDSPYSTPLTTLFWFITKGIASIVTHLQHSVLRRGRRQDEERSLHLRNLEESYKSYNQLMRKGITKGVEKLATTSSGLATFVLSSTFDLLDGISDLEKFLSYIPGFYASASAQEHFQINGAASEDFNSNRLPSKINLFMEHVLSSNLLTTDEKKNHIAMCSKAMNADASILRSTFKLTLQNLDSEVFEYPDFVGLALEQLRRDNADSWMKSYSQCVMAIAINRAQVTAAWTNIVGRYLDAEDAQHWPNVNAIRLCNLIYLIRHLKTVRLATSDQFTAGKLWHNVLSKAQNVDVTGTAAELGQNFFILWDELAIATRSAPTDQQRRNATHVCDLLRAVNAALRAEHRQP